MASTEIKSDPCYVKHTIDRIKVRRMGPIGVGPPSPSLRGVSKDRTCTISVKGELLIVLWVQLCLGFALFNTISPYRFNPKQAGGGGGRGEILPPPGFS